MTNTGAGIVGIQQAEATSQLEHLDAVTKANAYGCPATEESTYMIAGPVAVIPLGMLLKKVDGPVAVVNSSACT